MKHHRKEHKVKVYWCFATWQAVSLFPQRLKTGFRRNRRKPVFACWDSIPNPLNSPVAGAGCAFGSRTLLSLLRRDRRDSRPLENRKKVVPALPEKGKTETGLHS